MGVGWDRRERNKLKFNFHLKAQSFPIQEHTNWDEAQQNHWRPIDLAIKWWILPMKCISIDIELSSCVWPYFINKSKVPREWHFGRNKFMLLICSSNIFVNETDDYIQIAPTIDANLSHTHTTEGCFVHITGTHPASLAMQHLSSINGAIEWNAHRYYQILV